MVLEGVAEAETYDCSVGGHVQHPLPGQAEWSEAKASWCCKHRSKGCLAEAEKVRDAKGEEAAEEEHHDCRAGYLEWRTAWSADKSKWCCKHFGRGCLRDTAPVVEEYDCFEGYESWAESWTVARSQWCCNHYGRGCTGGGAPVIRGPTGQYDCDAGLPQYWSQPKAQWCCERRSRGCSVTESRRSDVAGSERDKFNCYEGFRHWGDWPTEKQEWCCSAKGFGCKKTTTTQPFDCKFGAANWREGWSEGKQAWCCLYEQIGCRGDDKPAAPEQDLYNCEVGLFNWQKGWEYKKKEWCCIYGSSIVRRHLHEVLGCPTIDGDHQVVTATFQKKFKSLHDEMVVVGKRLKKMWAPTLVITCTLVVIAGAIRTWSRAPGGHRRSLENADERQQGVRQYHRYVPMETLTANDELLLETEDTETLGETSMLLHRV